ncbi:hypothetical protein fugu_000816 [Takifugu bimaculatus]|uniref:Uncharacterized protein n=1 Tax=Takifugu bimaculatus TaxID=433685 RepID=A0A4Z2CHS6_9TELE|nr:hypothetical protein fugu_000816 [Takifugu bimaculatus]
MRSSKTNLSIMFSGSSLKDTAIASIHQQTYGSGLSNQRRCREHRSSGKADPDLNTQMSDSECCSSGGRPLRVHAHMQPSTVEQRTTVLVGLQIYAQTFEN